MGSLNWHREACGGVGITTGIGEHGCSGFLASPLALMNNGVLALSLASTNMCDGVSTTPAASSGKGSWQRCLPWSADLDVTGVGECCAAVLIGCVRVVGVPIVFV